MAVTNLTPTTGAFFGLATGLVAPAWANFRAITEFKNLTVDGSTYEIVSRALNPSSGDYEYDHSCFIFDTSSITDATAATFKINCTSFTAGASAVLVRGDITLPFSSTHGLNRMFGWPTSATPFSLQSFLGNTGLLSFMLNAAGVSYINSNNSIQIYLIEGKQLSNLTAPTSGQNLRAQFNTTNLQLSVTTPDPPSDYMKISNGAIKILSGKVSL